MKNTTVQSKAFWLVSFLLILVTVFFGLRGRSALNAGSFVASSVADSLREGSAEWMPDTILVNQKSAHLAAAVMTGRNPFTGAKKVITKPKPADPGPKLTMPDDPKPPVLNPPSLRALLYDTVHPSAKLNRDGEVSGWLHVGDEFRGWVIVEITSNAVTVKKDGQTRVLE